MRETAQLKPGQPAPDFTLDDLQGQSISLSDFRGQAVFLDFWASWCGPCIGAAPHLEELKQRVRDQKVVFLNISLDSADEWHQAVEEHGLTGVHVHAPGGWRAAVAQLYQVPGHTLLFLSGSRRPDGWSCRRCRRCRRCSRRGLSYRGGTVWKDTVVDKRAIGDNYQGIAALSLSGETRLLQVGWSDRFFGGRAYLIPCHPFLPKKEIVMKRLTAVLMLTLAALLSSRASRHCPRRGDNGW